MFSCASKLGARVPAGGSGKLEWNPPERPRDVAFRLRALSRRTTEIFLKDDISVTTVT
jgi:hypothetical protein